MKKNISTVNMNRKDKHMLMGDLLSSFGNGNIRFHHIQYFENKILDYNENKLQYITKAPNYYAWLCLITEHLFWLMRSFCFQQNKFEHDDFALLYNDLITKFYDTCRSLNLFSEVELQELHKKTIKILEVRHAIIHKGFPNLLPIIFENKHVKKKPAMSKGGSQARFTEESTRESIEWFSNPSNFNEIKKDYHCLIKAISSKGTELSIGL